MNKKCGVFFWDRVSLCSPGYPGTQSVDQAGLELRNPPASASQVLGLKVWATTAQLRCNFLKQRQCHKLGVHSMWYHQVFANYFNTDHILHLSFHSSTMNYDLVRSMYYTKTYVHWISLNIQAPFPTFPAHWSYVKQQRGIWLGFSLLYLYSWSLYVNNILGENELSAQKVIMEEYVLYYKYGH